MIDTLSTKKNLLAFSAGIDSSALFFILLSKNISFDIAIVDYKQRNSSHEEVKHAKSLAIKYNKRIFVKNYTNNNFNEKLAREFRYDFFEDIILEHKYESLITAHQLNDKLEWFLMQLAKGAGVIELIGLSDIEKRAFYTIYRPLLKISKNEILEYLHKNHIKYFIDESNSNLQYTRNFFRQKFSDNFIDLYKNGLIKSFSYIDRDINSLKMGIEDYFSLKEFIMIKFDSYDENMIIRAIDKEIKKRGFLISSKTRNEILLKKSIVVSHKICVEIFSNSIIIAPFVIASMNKEFKEECRINKIPKKLRSYLSTLEYKDFKRIQEKIKNL